MSFLYRLCQNNIYLPDITNTGGGRLSISIALAMQNDNRERVVVIGGGFAGLNLCKRLDKKKYNISLVDRNNFHCFPPLFYQIASSGLVESNICFPFRR